MLLKRKREKEGKGKDEKRCAECQAPNHAKRGAALAPSRYRPWRETPPYRHDHGDDHGHGCAMRAVMATAARKRATVVARRSVESNGGNRPGNAGRKKVDIAFSITGQIKPTNQKSISAHRHYTTMPALSILAVNISDIAQINLHLPAVVKSGKLPEVKSAQKSHSYENDGVLSLYQSNSRIFIGYMRE